MEWLWCGAPALSTQSCCCAATELEPSRWHHQTVTRQTGQGACGCCWKRLLPTVCVWVFQYTCAIFSYWFLYWLWNWQQCVHTNQTKKQNTFCFAPPNIKCWQHRHQPQRVCVTAQTFRHFKMCQFNFFPVYLQIHLIAFLPSNNLQMQIPPEMPQ